MESPRRRIIVALDVDTEEEALALVRQLKDYAGFFKIGLGLVHSAGTGVVKKVAKLGAKVFYDGKFHDIPNTVAAAARAAVRMQIAMFTVHTLGGLEMMKETVYVCREEARTLGVKAPLVLGVTILTSIDEKALNEELRIPGFVRDEVVWLAEMAYVAGLDGVIASPLEIEIIRSRLPKEFLVITPGVRPIWAGAEDQKRIMTPAEAIAKGASYLVIGRPITRPPSVIASPLEAANLIANEIEQVLGSQ